MKHIDNITPADLQAAILSASLLACEQMTRYNKPYTGTVLVSYTSRENVTKLYELADARIKMTVAGDREYLHALKLVDGVDYYLAEPLHRNFTLSSVKIIGVGCRRIDPAHKGIKLA